MCGDIQIHVDIAMSVSQEVSLITNKIDIK